MAKAQRRLLAPENPGGWDLCLDCRAWIRGNANCLCDVEPVLRGVIQESIAVVRMFDAGGDYGDLSNAIYELKLKLAEAS